jgi:hypothetical protein
MVDPIARFTSLELMTPVAKARPAPAVRQEPQPQAEAQLPQKPVASVDVRLSAEARALLSQIAEARGERDQHRRPDAPGSRVNIVV